MFVSVNNIKINNTLYSNSPVKVIDTYPTINWDYDLVNRVEVSGAEIVSTDTISHFSYEIRIGTTNTHLTTDSYVGDTFQTGTVVSEATGWRYRGPNLVRGTHYYGQIRITDSLYNTSDWASFGFVYNRLPRASNAVISPSSPIISDQLLLSYNFIDLDGDSESGTQIWWYQNGIHNSLFNNKLVIPSQYVKYGDSWLAEIRPKDGYEFGSVVITSTITVERETPVISDLAIAPINPTTANPLYALYNYESSELDNSQIIWYVNNAVASTGSRFIRLPLIAGDIVKFELQVDTTTYTSPEVTIAESPIRVSNLAINSSVEPYNTSLTPDITWNTR